MLFDKEDLQTKYSTLNKFTNFVKKPEREIIGREKEMNVIKAAMMRPELCNVILLGEAGSGKTAIVQGIMMQDSSRYYLEVNLSNMISVVGSEGLPGSLESLFREVIEFGENEKKEIVLFIDEFHRIIQSSPAAVEALKPLLADSGTRGVKVIAATTFVEFQQWISPNQPLVERLQRINITQPGKEITIAILKDMAKRYGIVNQIYDDNIYELIYEYTNRYVPSNSQPRKSILILDSMIGWHRLDKRKLDKALLADVIYEQEGINVSFRVDATKIKSEIDKHVFDQGYASTVIENQLQACVADINDKNLPMSSLLFTGSSGTGKTETTKQLARILFEDPRRLIMMDMSEFANSDSIDRFKDELTMRVWSMPHSIVLLDEIEKACAEVTKLLLQVLGDGRLTDRNNRTVVFTNCYVILTTNAGSEVYRTIAQYEDSDSFIDDYQNLIYKSIMSTTGENKFPPELLGRIGKSNIVPFNPLTRETQYKIVEAKLKELKADILKKHNKDLRISKDVLKYIVDERSDTQSDSGGARAILSRLKSDVVSQVAKFINVHPYTPVLGVKVEGEMACDNKHKVKSDAKIAVVEVKARN